LDPSSSELPVVEVESIIIGSPDLHTAEQRRDMDMSSPPGFNYARERNEERLEVRFGKALILKHPLKSEELNEAIQMRKQLLTRFHATQLHLSMINCSLFRFEKIQEILEDCDFDEFIATIRGSKTDPRLLEFIRRHDGKTITLEMEDSLLDTPTLLALPRLSSIRATWLSGFRGIWEHETGLPEQDFLELVRRRHEQMLIPVKIEDERVLLEAVKIVSQSDTNQTVILRILPPLRKRFNSLIGLKEVEGGGWNVGKSSGFTVNEQGSLQYGNARVSMRYALTRRFYGPGSMPHYFVHIVREL
ncbi:hypothetical protein PMAYCL1PPCAC_10517, partial [Pristionchus mayeri]